MVGGYVRGRLGAFIFVYEAAWCERRVADAGDSAGGAFGLFGT